MSNVEQFYNENAQSEWERLGARHRTEYGVTLRALGEFLPPAPAKIIDIGGGPGRYAIALSKQGYRVTLVDLSQACLDLAAKKSDAAGVKLDQRLCANALDLSALAKKKFEAALLLGPLYHLHKLEERQAALAQAAGLLKPGGLIFVSMITRFASFRDAALNGFSYAQDDPAYSEKLLATGIHDSGQGFTDAYFAHPDEVVPLCEGAGFSTLRLMGCEGVTAGREEYINSLTGAAWDFWLDLNYRFSQEPSLLGASDHILYIGRKEAA